MAQENSVTSCNHCSRKKVVNEKEVNKLENFKGQHKLIAKVLFLFKGVPKGENRVNVPPIVKKTLIF